MKRPWTLPGLAAVYTLAMGGEGLDEIAEATGRFKAECDLALWALVGRSPEAALARLNSGLQGEAPAVAATPKSAVLGRFVRETLP
ncbi:hypothetical protein [Phenylobacterium sp.]|uniref:hypothetical protein n=1 Tax=Phenylobacterium sp. TaxID=1871053 RepID=UPI002730259E|nr:hypothetical protein [Phenylobacterium sp.]MDP1617311.1 hypothetical protein [Phenylobacterium sp.]MDP1985683.1 hypothetical protein [Phenylobacterium sp.]